MVMVTRGGTKAAMVVINDGDGVKGEQRGDGEDGMVMNWMKGAGECDDE